MKKNNFTKLFPCGLLKNQTIPFIQKGEWAIHELLPFLLSAIGKAEVRIATFNIAEESLRAIFFMLEKRDSNVYYLVNSNNIKITSPLHFGLAPFMKFRVFLENLFNFEGYSFSYNDFTDYYPSFEKIILLHNNADTMISVESEHTYGEYYKETATFQKRQAVPDMEIINISPTAVTV